MPAGEWRRRRPRRLRQQQRMRRKRSRLRGQQGQGRVARRRHRDPAGQRGTVVWGKVRRRALGDQKTDGGKERHQKNKIKRACLKGKQEASERGLGCGADFQGDVEQGGDATPVQVCLELELVVELQGGGWRREVEKRARVSTADKGGKGQPGGDSCARTSHR